MTIKTTKWDAAEFLNPKEEILAYLEAAFEDGDPSGIKLALNNVARARGISDLARETKISREGIYKALSEDGDPKLSTLLSIVKAFGLNLSVRDLEHA